MSWVVWDIAGLEGAHHGLIVEKQALARTHGGCRAGKGGKDDESLTLHLAALEGDDVDDLAIS